MRDNFAAFILTHGRPDKVYTYDSLVRAGYTGKVYLVIDDEDKTGQAYRDRFGDRVLCFSKAKIAEQFDEGDNFRDRRAIIYARNACFDLAKQVGCRYFIQLDDDYTSFFIRHNADFKYVSARIKSTMDEVLSSMLDYFISTPCASVAMSQGGDHLGGGGKPGALGGQYKPGLRRKCMNSFICDTERRFWFHGRINEDVNTYTWQGRNGLLFFTVLQSQLVQKATQSNAGGMTSTYLESGTYVKSFYSVMYCPSAVKVGEMGDHRSPHYRIHHAINWHNVAPKILRETHRKASRNEVLTKEES